jgi:hypothetical protein
MELLQRQPFNTSSPPVRLDPPQVQAESILIGTHQTHVEALGAIREMKLSCANL